ncbi:hypothetical protein [Flavobacterium sp. N502540]|uniref:hypothetical protein n=1 Tax=Flavobacterium sp. N502540 TaxID=2986838 RepID=UPI002224922C|nr:hypothetical protein [Flavobacterium sp. N502540]
MSYRLLFISILLLLYGVSYSQVGIGNSKPDNSAMLDIVSTNKGVIIPRIALTGSKDLTTIANGNVESLLVYNIATVSDITPGYYYWSKNKWNKIAITDDTLSVTAGNGLTFSNGKLQLGGALETPTTVTTTAINTLAIKGLEAGDLTTDEIVVADKSTGALKKVATTSFVQEKQELYIAKEGQAEFTTVSPINDPQKVNVYRNGIRVDFSIVKPGTIKLEPSAICYQNDEVRIVLIY